MVVEEEHTWQWVDKQWHPPKGLAVILQTLRLPPATILSQKNFRV